MEWPLLDWNSTVPEIWDNVVDTVNTGSGVFGKFLFDKIVLPLGQYLLYHAELAVQYTLNGEYEVCILSFYCVMATMDVFIQNIQNKMGAKLLFHISIIPFTLLKITSSFLNTNYSITCIF